MLTEREAMDQIDLAELRGEVWIDREKALVYLVSEIQKRGAVDA